MTYMMNSMERIRWKAWGRRTGTALALALSLGALSGCDDLLEVELPAQLGDDAVNDPAGATTLVNTVIGHFENGWNWKVARSHGQEAACEELLQSPGVEDFCEYPETIDSELYEPISISRSFAAQLHGKLTDDWTVADVPQRAQYLAIASIYAGGTLEVMADHLCEITIDAGQLMTPTQVYTQAEQRLTRAISEIQSAGDFALPHGIASSANALAHGLRARIRWMMGNDTGAMSDLARVPEGFLAVGNRDPGVRFNLVANHTQTTGFVELYGMIDWWVGPPFNGKAWPTPIPFTGYHYLGLLPDGRAVTDAGYPIRTTDPDGGMRAAIFGPDEYPGLEATAVSDARVPHTWDILQGSGEDRLFQAKWRSEADDFPWVTWKEMQLIAAEIEGGQAAIDRVNAVRAFESQQLGVNLPPVTYADPNNAEEIRYMIVEERRRSLFVEGRFFNTMLRNTDILWFPRGGGGNLEKQEAYGGGVKFLMPANEYLLNPNLTDSDRATGCASDVAPTGF